jgi:hypothetical protein
VPFFFDLSNPFAETKECNNKISISGFLINQLFQFLQSGSNAFYWTTEKN